MKYLLFILIISLAFNPPSFKRYHLTGFAQGTSWLITYYASDSLVTKNQVDSILNKIDSSLSIYKPYSNINAFNNSDSGLMLDDHFLKVINKSLATYYDTKGAFDITILPLMKAWGFGKKQPEHLPDSQTISSVIKCIGTDKLSLHKKYLAKKIPCITIDVNGIAQGYSVDVLASFLEKNRIKNYLVELGGEIRVKGRRQPSNEMMKVGIEAPADSESPDPIMQKITSFKSGAITTSGSYRKFHQQEGKKVNHIINPATGFPVDNELISVTVFAKDAITADAYDNALMVMGLKEALEFVEKRKWLAAHFIYKNKNGEIADTASTRFKKLIVE